MYSEFQELACLFFRTICSRCGMESDDPFWGFLSPGAQQPVQPSNNICLVYAAKKYMYIYFMHSSEKDNHPSPLPQQGFCTSLQIWDELSVTWQTTQRFVFCLPSQGPLILKHSLFMTLSGLGFLVESPILYLAFLKTILAALFRTFGLPLRFLPSKPSFLHDHFTTQHSHFSSFFSRFYDR